MVLKLGPFEFLDACHRAIVCMTMKTFKMPFQNILLLYNRTISYSYEFKQPDI